MTTSTDFLRGSLVALLTPMRPDGEIDYAAFEQLIDFHAGAGTRAIVVASTTGEAPTLSFDEHVQLYRRAVQHAAGRIPIIAGVGSPSTHVACELAGEAQHERADAVLCVTPYYNRPNASGLGRHFTTVAEAIEIPIILYDVPRRTGVQIPDELIFELSEHPNIVGLKDATGDTVRAKRLLAGVHGGFRLLSGDDSTAFDLMAAGGAGVISVVANVAPSAVRAMCDAIGRGEIEEAFRLNEALGPLYGLLSADTNPVPAKWLACKLGLMSGVLRAPLEITPSLSQFFSSSDAFNASRHLLGA
jgi:4-hydroxy-tetrahydrodipicolinate synthase